MTRQVNDPCEALVLKDKVRFAEVFEDILGRRVMTFDEIKRQMHDPYSISINEVVIKPIKGQAGQGIIFRCKTLHHCDNYMTMLFLL